MKAVYLVQVIDRTTGRDSWVRVESTSREEALQAVIDLGEMVGEVRLSEVIDADAEPAPFLPPVPLRAIASPGACPLCGGVRWEGGRSCLTWVGVILFFPFGLLFLLVKPRWQCQTCRYSYSSYSLPPGRREESGAGYRAIKFILWVVVAIAVGLLLLGVAGAVWSAIEGDPIEARRKATTIAPSSP